MSEYTIGQNAKRGSGDILLVLLIAMTIFYLVFSFTVSKSKDQNTNISSSEVNVLPMVVTEAAKKANDAILQKGEEISWETDRYKFVFSSQFGVPKKIVLKDYKDNKGELFDVSAQFEDPTRLPLGYEITNYNSSNGFKVQKTANALIFTRTEKGLTLQKTYSFSPKDYSFKLEIRLTNHTGKELLLDSYLGWGKGLGPFVPKEEQVQYDTVITQAYYDGVTDKEVVNEYNPEVGHVNWAGIDNRYFLLAIMPEEKGESLVKMTESSSTDPFNQFIQLGNRLSIGANKTSAQNFTIYLGPKKKSLLTPFGKNLERVVERGWFFFPLLGSFLIGIVTLIKGLIGSYGLAIIIFAVLLRLLFHPLNVQSMVAMSKQGELQSKVKAIKDKYTDKATQNVKIMELYRTEQTGMLKGCLPLLIQIPFFITFYQQLPHLVDLTQSQFLWIKDLSSPDTVYRIDALKNVPILPYHINILPIIITFATIWQMRLSMKSSASSAQSKVMLYTMPLVFLFILWNAPAALNLYWLTQTVATMASQAYFNKHKARILEKDKAKKKQRKNYTRKEG